MYVSICHSVSVWVSVWTTGVCVTSMCVCCRCVFTGATGVYTYVCVCGTRVSLCVSVCDQERRALMGPGQVQNRGRGDQESCKVRVTESGMRGKSPSLRVLGVKVCPRP